MKRRNGKNNTTMKRNSEGLGTSISEMLDTEYRGVSLIYGCDHAISDCDLWTGMSVVEQIQTYHQQYGELQNSKTISPAANGTPTYAD